MEGLTSDKLVTLAYQPGRRLLAAGTRGGRVVLWKAARVATAEAPERAWEPLAPANVSSPPVQLAWAQGEGMLAARGEGGLSLLPETVLRRVMSGKWCLVQLNAQALARRPPFANGHALCALARVTPAIAITCTGVATGTHVGREKAVAAAGRLPHQGLRHARGAGARVVWRCSPSARIRRLARSAALRRRIRERRRFGRNLGRESLPAYEWSGRSGQFCGAREVHATFYGGGGGAPRGAHRRR